MLLLDAEEFCSGDLMGGLEYRFPIDVVVRIAYDASMDFRVVGFDVENTSSTRKSAERFGRSELLAMSVGVVAPPDVDLSDNTFVAVIEEREPSRFVGAVDVLIVAGMTMETNEHIVFAGFLSAGAHLFSALLIRIFAFANAAFETARDDQEAEPNLSGEIRAGLEVVAFDLVEADMRAGRFEPNVVEHLAKFRGAISMITGEFDEFKTSLGNPLQVLRECIVIDDVAERIELKPNRNMLFIFLVLGQRGSSERTKGCRCSSAKPCLQE